MYFDLSVLNTTFRIIMIQLVLKIMKNYLISHNAKVAYGGYNEERNLYQRSTIFKDEKTEERNIHIGFYG
jgi:hypothetical protein